MHRDGGFGPGYMDNHHDAWLGWHWIVPLLSLLAIAAFVVWAVLRTQRHPVAAGPAAPALPAEDAALRELRLRYARGEVTREEFLATEADLRGIAAPPPPPPASS